MQNTDREDSKAIGYLGLIMAVMALFMLCLRNGWDLYLLRPIWKLFGA